MNHSPAAAWADKKAYRWPLVAFVVSALVLGAYGFMFVSDEIARNKEEKAVRAKAEQAALQRKALQEQCGGPEATVTPKASGGYECTNKRGKKTTIPGLARPVSQGPEHAARVFGARLQQRNFECANSFCETEPAGLVPVGFLKG